jgi:hypothetical protein
MRDENGVSKEDRVRLHLEGMGRLRFPTEDPDLLSHYPARRITLPALLLLHP